jgi:methyl-accepting chemotaxis protein
MANVARMRDTLAAIVAEMRQAAQGVSVATREMAKGNDDLDARTGRQASALEQATTALSEFDTSVAANASNAMRGHACQTGFCYREGGAAVDRLVDAMQGISASSNRIGEILAVIDSIAVGRAHAHRAVKDVSECVNGNSPESGYTNSFE